MGRKKTVADFKYDTTLYPHAEDQLEWATFRSPVGEHGDIVQIGGGMVKTHAEAHDASFAAVRADREKLRESAARAAKREEH